MPAYTQPIEHSDMQKTRKINIYVILYTKRRKKNQVNIYIPITYNTSCIPNFANKYLSEIYIRSPVHKVYLTYAISSSITEGYIRAWVSFKTGFRQKSIWIENISVRTPDAFRPVHEEWQHCTPHTGRHCACS